MAWDLEQAESAIDVDGTRVKTRLDGPGIVAITFSGQVDSIAR